MEILEQLHAAAALPGEGQARAMLALGNALYENGHRQEAITWWEKAVRLERTLAEAWRNLGVAYFNVLQDIPAAKGALTRALQMNPTNARIFHDRDQLLARTKELPLQRLEEMENHLDLVNKQDDLAVAYAVLLNQVQRFDAALELLRQHEFQTRQESGEISPLGQWRRTHIALGRKALWQDDATTARQYLEAGVRVPRNFGDAQQLPHDQTELHYWNGIACHRIGDAPAAKQNLEHAAQFAIDLPEALVLTRPEIAYFSALATDALHGTGFKVFERMRGIADNLSAKSTISEPASAPPKTIQIDRDPQMCHAAQAKLLEALASWGLGDKKASRRMLGDILRDDPSHSMAADLMVSIDWE